MQTGNHSFLNNGVLGEPMELKEVKEKTENNWMGKCSVLSLFSLLSQPLYDVIKKDSFLISYLGRKSIAYYA